jgi:hypothetical protein
MVGCGGRAGLSVDPGARAETFVTRLSGDNEVPPNASPASGTATLTKVEGTASSFRYEVVAGLEAGSSLEGVHLNIAPPGQNGPIVQTLAERNATFPVIGKKTLSDSQLQALRAGLVYVNVRTVEYVPGEIRGWLVLQ